MATLLLPLPGSPRLRVVSFSGLERLGRPYAFHLRVEGGPDLPPLSPACLDLGEGVRFHGLLSLWEPMEEGGHRARLEPRLHLLAGIHRQRALSPGTLRELLQTLLEEAGIPAAFALEGPHPGHAFLCQHQESTLDLLLRHCAKEGVTSFFRQEEGGERVVFVDGREALPRLDHPLRAPSEWLRRHRPPSLDPATGLPEGEGRLLVLGCGADPGLGAGCRFRLEGEAEYLALEVAHEGAEDGAYRQRFRAVEAGSPHPLEDFPPAPLAEGLRWARTEGPGDGRGLTPLRLPWQEQPPAPPPLPAASPYRGEDHGWHFPLEVGTEVALGFREGDPDRPVILGALPRPEAPGEAHSLRSAGGRRLDLGRDRLSLASGASSLSMEADPAGSTPEGAPVPEGAARFSLETPGTARWWAEDDRSDLTHGLRVDATAGASIATALIQRTSIELGPRFDFHPALTSSVAHTSCRWVLGTEFRWAATSRQVSTEVTISAADSIRNLEVFLRSVFLLGLLGQALAQQSESKGKGTRKVNGAMAVLVPLCAQALAVVLEEWLQTPMRDVSLVMSGAFPLVLGSVYGGHSDCLALADRGPDDLVANPGAGWTTLGGRLAHQHPVLEDWSLPLRAGPWRPLACLASRSSAFLLLASEDQTSSLNLRTWHDRNELDTLQIRANPLVASFCLTSHEVGGPFLLAFPGYRMTGNHASHPGNPRTECRFLLTGPGPEPTEAEQQGGRRASPPERVGVPLLSMLRHHGELTAKGSRIVLAKDVISLLVPIPAAEGAAAGVAAAGGAAEEGAAAPEQKQNGLSFRKDGTHSIRLDNGNLDLRLAQGRVGVARWQ